MYTSIWNYLLSVRLATTHLFINLRDIYRCNENLSWKSHHNNQLCGYTVHYNAKLNLHYIALTEEVSSSIECFTIDAIFRLIDWN